VSDDCGRGEEQRMGAASAVRRGKGRGAFHRVGDAVGGGEGRWPAAVEFYSSSVSMELKGEVETGRRRLDGGNEEGGAPVRFGYSRAEESGRRRRTRSDVARGAALSMGAGGGRRRPGGPYRAERPSDEMGQKQRRLQHKLFFNFKQDFRLKKSKV
jgi:hypothetical protein